MPSATSTTTEIAPLKPNKRLQHTLRQPTPKSSAAVTMPDLDFRCQMHGVTPLVDENRVYFTPPRPSPHPRKQPRITHTLPPQHIGWFEPADQQQHFVRTGMQNATLRKLRTGYWPVCAELDLHGFNRYEAQEQLVVFLQQARCMGQCVRIIHGRGLGSQNEPVLKHMTRTWLTHHPDILAWCDSHDGGALLALLRTMTF